MSFTLQPLFDSQSGLYTSFAIATAISYDYCHTVSREITYVWVRPWTKVSTLFLLIRYAGLLYPVTFALSGSLAAVTVQVRHYSLNGSPSEHHRHIEVDLICESGTQIQFSFKGNSVQLLIHWSYVIFWAAAEMVMILRVHAIYNRSRIVLGSLLVVYVVEVIALIVSAGIYSNPRSDTVTISQLNTITICTTVFKAQVWNTASAIIQFILGILLCTLVVAQFVRDLLQTHQVIQKWWSNRYLSLLARDGVLYFLVTLLNSLINMLGVLGTIPSMWATRALVVISTVSLYTLTPRFVINVRELYVRDTQGRWDHDIDTMFGLSSRSRHGVGGTTTIGTLVFGRVGTDRGVEDGEEIVTPTSL